MRIESRTRDRKFARYERVLRIRRKNTVERDIGSTRISTRASSRVESLAVKLYPTPHRTRKEERKREEEEKYSSLAGTVCVREHPLRARFSPSNGLERGLVHLLLAYTDRSSIIFTGLTRVILGDTNGE